MPNHQQRFFNHHNHHNGVVIRPVIYPAPVVYSSGYSATPVIAAPVYTAGNTQVMYQPAPVIQRPAAVVYTTPCCVIL